MPQHLVVKRVYSGTLVAALCRIDVEEQDTLTVEARIERLQVFESSHKETSAKQQQQRQCHLRNQQASAQPQAKPPGARLGVYGARALLEGGGQIHPSALHCGCQSEQNGSDKRDGSGKAEDARIGV